MVVADDAMSHEERADLEADAPPVEGCDRSKAAHLGPCRRRRGVVARGIGRKVMEAPAVVDPSRQERYSL